MPLMRGVVRLVVKLAYIPKKWAFRSLLAAADRARDLGQTRKAVILYKRTTKLFPFDASFKVQLGNMLKDCGRFDDARQSYEAARDLRPDDADLYLQLGHLTKLQGKRQEATAFYRRSSLLDPGRPDAAAELAAMDARSWIDDWTMPVTAAAPGIQQPSSRPLVLLSADRDRLVLERLMVAFENRPR